MSNKSARNPSSTPFIVPSDPFWPRRVHARNDGDCVPFEYWLIWHHQFFLPKGENT